MAAARSSSVGWLAQRLSRPSTTSGTTNSTSNADRLALLADRALAVAGDDKYAVALVAGVIDRVGYDAVQLASLSAGRLLQPGGPLFGTWLSRDQLEMAVSAMAG